MPVGRDLGKCAPQFGSLGRVASRQDVEVGEVAPAGVDGAALQCGDDLLRVHHGQRVAGQGDRPAEQFGQVHGAWGWPDRVADADVDVQAELRAGQRRGQGDADAAVLVVVADDVYRGGVGVEDESPVIARAWMSTSRVGRRAS